mmetsp:Transcript_10861/g.22430  ORF Transcript_10861/g.22430 Transcript_10861/m.22430 type:complete len:394 (-) Transcript_10861:95-1276(-)
MGTGQSHPSRVCCVDTGCLVSSHSSDKGKFGPGGAALALKDGILVLAGNKGMAVYDTKHIVNRAASGDNTGGDNGTLPRIGEIIDTSAIAIHGGCDICFYEDKWMYVAGGKGLAVFDVSNGCAAPKKVGETIDTGALTHNSGAALCICDGYMYVAGGNGLAVFSLKSSAEKPVKLGEVIDTGALSHNGGASIMVVEQGGRNLLYVLGGKGLAVMDIGASVENPPRVGEVLNTGCVSSCGCPALCKSGSGELMFMAGGKALGILNVTDPRAPAMVGQPINTGVMAHSGGSAMVVDTSDQLYGKMHTLLLAGGKGLGVFTLPNAKDFLEGKALDRKGKIETGALSHDSDSAILLDESTRMLYTAGGNGLAVFDLTKFDGATVSLSPEDIDLAEAD